MPRALSAVVLLVAMLALAACGGDDDGSSGGGRTATESSAPPAADVDFPKRANSMRALRQGLPEQAVFSPAVSQLRVGKNRIGFALFDEGRAQLNPDAVAVYVAEPGGRGLRGPFEAHRESLRVSSQFMSRQTAADLDEVDSFWVADGVTFPKAGSFLVTALVSTDGELAAASQLEMRVGARGGPPDIGDRAIRVHTETLEDAAGNIESIDTRIPPLPELHDTDLYDVLGKEPVVIAFATPQLCQTRVCGPVVDAMAEVRARNEGPTYIHQEIFEDNDINAGLREPVAAWRLQTEPWLFLIDRDGRIVERFEGAVSVREIERAVQKLQPG